MWKADTLRERRVPQPQFLHIQRCWDVLGGNLALTVVYQ